MAVRNKKLVELFESGELKNLKAPLKRRISGIKRERGKLYRLQRDLENEERTVVEELAKISVTEVYKGVAVSVTKFRSSYSPRWMVEATGGKVKRRAIVYHSENVWYVDLLKRDDYRFKRIFSCKTKKDVLQIARDWVVSGKMK